MRRERAAARLLHGWDNGFPGGSGLVMSALAVGYRGLLGAREWLYERHVFHSRALSCPVISIGNLTVGGTGKTPAVELAVRTLSDLGRRPAVISRGYRRRSSGVQIVADTASIRLDPEDAGDEPFLLARRLPGVPVVVGGHRYEAARAAVERFGATAIVLDDGFQHRTLRKDLEVVMVRAGQPWGNGRLLPSGPLREPLAALGRADLIVATSLAEPVDLAAVSRTVARYAPGVPLLAARYAAVECWEASRMRTVPLGQLAGKRLLGFAGIASPVAFRATLDTLGVGASDLATFADHHWYTAADVSALDARAERAGAADGLVTTEKDWVRLRTLPLPDRPLYVVSVRLELVTGEDDWRRAFEDACRTR